MAKSLSFKYGNTVEQIRVTKIANDFERQSMKEKIIEFVQGKMSDDINMKSNKGDRMGLTDLYEANEDDEPIIVELKTSGD